jgi:hypothetical protein
MGQMQAVLESTIIGATLLGSIGVAMLGQRVLLAMFLKALERRPSFH